MNYKDVGGRKILRATIAAVTTAGAVSFIFWMGGYDWTRGWSEPGMNPGAVWATMTVVLSAVAALFAYTKGEF